VNPKGSLKFINVGSLHVCPAVEFYFVSPPGDWGTVYGLLACLEK
jgi:hypothetical protein